MSFDRSTTIRGPAIITFDSMTFYPAGNIKVSWKLVTAPQRANAYGRVGSRRDDLVIDVSFTPIGKWGYYTKLWPHTTPIQGASLAGATDKSLVIQTHNGVQETFKGAFLSKMPSGTFSAVKPIWGECTFSFVGANNTAWSDAVKRLVIASQAFSDTSFAIADEVRQPYAIAYGAASPWSTMETLDGIVVTPSMQTKARKTDTDGTIDFGLGDVEWVAKCTPVGESEAQLLALIKTQGTGVTRGSLITDNALVLNIIGTGVYVRIYLAVPSQAEMDHDVETERLGAIQFDAQPWFTAGVQQPLVYLGTGAPV